MGQRHHGSVLHISIHALREEGDSAVQEFVIGRENFYPRPPRGGRRDLADAFPQIMEFLSTPSARRATGRRDHADQWLRDISIHALREEGDGLIVLAKGVAGQFLSTPSARRATADTIINDAAVQKLLDNRRIEIGNAEPELLPDGTAIVARLNVLGRIISVISYDLTYTDDEGNDKLYIPSGKCVLTAPGAGRTAYGAVSQVEQSDGEFHTYAGRRVPKYVSSAEGNSRTLTISSRPLMIPNNKNPFIVADVLTD